MGFAVNLLPVPPDPHLVPGRASQLVSEVLPARDPRQAQGQQEQVSRQRSPQVINDVEREALLRRYADTLQQPLQRQYQGRDGRRVVDAYATVSQQDEREKLTNLLGISEYA